MSTPSYWTTREVDPRVKAQVEAEAARVAERHTWWAEALHFFNWPGKEGRLAGDTKVFVSSRATASGEAVEAVPEDYEFMSYYDSRFIGDHRPAGTEAGGAPGHLRLRVA